MATQNPRYPQDSYTPTPANHFTFGLWTVGNRGRDPFGDAVRARDLAACASSRSWPSWAPTASTCTTTISSRSDASPADRDRIVKEFKSALAKTGMKVPMATTNLFYDPVFKEGAFTSNDARVRALRAAEDDALDGPRRRARRQDLRLLGRPRGRSRPTPARTRRKRSSAFARRSTSSASTSIANKYDYKFALEAKPNEPRGDIFLPTSGHMLAFIYTLDHPEMVGLNPEIAHEQMPGSTSRTASARRSKRASSSTST